MSIWVNGIVENTTYFACRKEDMQRLHEALQELETQGEIDKDFLLTRSVQLLAKLSEDTEQTAKRELE